MAAYFGTAAVYNIRSGSSLLAYSTLDAAQDSMALTRSSRFRRHVQLAVGIFPSVAAMETIRAALGQDSVAGEGLEPNRGSVQGPFFDPDVHSSRGDSERAAIRSLLEVSRGLTEEQAREVLVQANGDANEAAAMILDPDFQPPRPRQQDNARFQAAAAAAAHRADPESGTETVPLPSLGRLTKNTSTG